MNGQSRNGASDPGWTQSFQRLVVVSYILAVAMPPLGLVLGFVVLGRGRRVHSRHGVWIILLSVVAAGAWAVIIASGAFTTTNPDF